MIELSRNLGESIMVGDIKITVMNINIATKQVCIGIEAPTNISIYRAEAYDSLQAEASLPFLSR
jgi:carbon storage regulator